MPRFRVPYPPEFRRQMVELVRLGRTPQDLAREFEPNAQSIADWVRQADREAGANKAGGTSSAEREELSRLRRENHRLRQERDILAKAAAWFATGLSAKGDQRPRPGLRIHERAPGRIPHPRHGPRAAGLGLRLLCVAQLAGLGPRPGRCRPAAPDPHDPWWFARHLRRAAGACRTAGRGHGDRPQARGTADARGRAARCVAAPFPDHDTARADAQASP